MSTSHSDDHAASAHDAGAHDFDGAPARALPADEPPTPTWVPVLGLALFAVAGVAFLASWSDTPAPQQAAPQQAAPQQAAPQQVAPQQQAAPRPLPPARPRELQPLPPGAPGAAAPQPPGALGAAPSPPPSASIRKLSAEEIDLVRKRIQEARQKNGAQPPPGQAQPQQPPPAQLQPNVK